MKKIKLNALSRTRMLHLAQEEIMSFHLQIARFGVLSVCANNVTIYPLIIE